MFAINLCFSFVCMIFDCCRRFLATNNVISFFGIRSFGVAAVCCLFVVSLFLFVVSFGYNRWRDERSGQRKTTNSNFDAIWERKNSEIDSRITISQSTMPKLHIPHASPIRTFSLFFGSFFSSSFSSIEMTSVSHNFLFFIPFSSCRRRLFAFSHWFMACVAELSGIHFVY